MIIYSSIDHESVSGEPSSMRETLTETGKLGLRLLEDLTALAAGGSVCVYLKLLVSSKTNHFTGFLVSHHFLLIQILICLCYAMFFMLLLIAFDIHQM